MSPLTLLSIVFVYYDNGLPESPEMQEIWVRSLGREDPLAEGMAAHSRILAWRLPWTEGPGGPQPLESQRIGHD